MVHRSWVHQRAQHRDSVSTKRGGRSDQCGTMWKRRKESETTFLGKQAETAGGRGWGCVSEEENST